MSVGIPPVILIVLSFISASIAFLTAVVTGIWICPALIAWFRLLAVTLVDESAAPDLLYVATSIDAIDFVCARSPKIMWIWSGISRLAAKAFGDSRNPGNGLGLLIG